MQAIQLFIQAPALEPSGKFTPLIISTNKNGTVLEAKTAFIEMASQINPIYKYLQPNDLLWFSCNNELKNEEQLTEINKMGAKIQCIIHGLGLNPNLFQQRAEEDKKTIPALRKFMFGARHPNAEKSSQQLQALPDNVLKNIFSNLVPNVPHQFPQVAHTTNPKILMADIVFQCLKPYAAVIYDEYAQKQVPKLAAIKAFCDKYQCLKRIFHSAQSKLSERTSIPTKMEVLIELVCGELNLAIENLSAKNAQQMIEAAFTKFCEPISNGHIVMEP